MSSHNDMTAAERELAGKIEHGGRVTFIGAGREIRGCVLSRVLLAAKENRPRKLCISDVRVTGEIDLEAGDVEFLVRFDRCSFDQPPVLEQAKIAGLYLVECTLPGLRAAQVQVSSSLSLRHCTVSGRIDLMGAHVTGQLVLRGSHVDGRGGEAVKADGLHVDQDLICSDGFSTDGLTRMIGAVIGGQFICDGATFRNPGEKTTLELNGLIVKEHVFWREGFTVHGRVSLRGAQIEGTLDCHRAHFVNPGELALEAVGMHVHQVVKFSSGCKVDGEINLTGCRVGGWVDFTGGEFVNEGRKAVDLARASIAQNLIFQAGAVVKGKVLLAGADVGGSLWAQGGRFENETDTAIDATGMHVHRDVLLSEKTLGSVADTDGFLARGRVVLSDVRVGGNLDCTGGRFTNPQRDAMIARGLTVTRDALLRNGFVAEGRVDLGDAKVGGSLDFTGARLGERGEALRCDRVTVDQSVSFVKVRAEGSVHMCNAKIGADVSFAGAALMSSKTALELKGSVVGSTLRLKFAERPAGALNFCRLRVATVVDKQSDWPDDAKLSNFVYGALREGSTHVSKRIAWLQRHHEYVPQVYRQLASAYRAAGLHHEAAKVLIAGEDKRRRERTGLPGRVHRTLWWILKPTVGYGYRPFWVLGWLAGLVVVGGVVFHVLGTGSFISTRNEVPVARFDPWLYTIDLLLPVVSLKHSDLWVPLGLAKWWSLFFTLVGWVLAICLVTGVGRLFKQDDR
ncbi:hypothetical protein [Lentzea terrae]|uniref:hypothetical protein n=1 Tax=Lentzea terrae TaxID=2200761 RepID=UPI001300751C|nr:hypothetical protein [Lentzea terrae]